VVIEIADSNFVSELLEFGYFSVVGAFHSKMVYHQRKACLLPS